MTQAKIQFERVARAFQKVLDNKNRDPVEYEDDVWSFIQNCWHLKDCSKNEVQGVAKATRQKIDAEVMSHPALKMMGDLANKSRDLGIRNDPSRAPEAQPARTQAGATAYIDQRSQPNRKSDADGVIYLIITDKKGDEIPFRNLSTKAMKDWMAIIKKYRIIYQIQGKKVIIHGIIDGRRRIYETLRQRILL